MTSETQNDKKVKSPSKNIHKGTDQVWGARNRDAANPGEAVRQEEADPVEAQREADVAKMLGWEKEQDFHGGMQMNGKSWKFYKSIPWDEWWDEFNTAMEPDGRLRYRTINAFIQAKAKNEYEKELLWEMMGPKRPQKSLRVPYLGDWMKRRSNGFWAFEDPGKLASIAEAIKHQDHAVKAATAIAPLAAKQIQRFARLAEKIDEAFCGRPFLPDLPPDDPKNKARFRAYVDMQKKASALESRGWEGYWMSYGLNPKDPTSWVTMVGAVPEQHTISPEEFRVAQLWDAVTREDVLWAKSMRNKAEMYPGLPSPDVSPPLGKEKKTH